MPSIELHGYYPPLLSAFREAHEIMILFTSLPWITKREGAGHSVMEPTGPR